MTGYTVPEIRRLLISLLQRYAPDPDGVWSWSGWRRRRQYQARLCHYRQRGYVLTLSAVAGRLCWHAGRPSGRNPARPRVSAYGRQRHIADPLPSRLGNYYFFPFFPLLFLLFLLFLAMRITPLPTRVGQRNVDQQRQRIIDRHQLSNTL